MTSSYKEKHKIIDMLTRQNEKDGAGIKSGMRHTRMRRDAMRMEGMQMRGVIMAQSNKAENEMRHIMRIGQA